MTSMDGGLVDQALITDQPSSAANTPQADTSIHAVNFDKTTLDNTTDAVSTGQTKSPTLGRTSEILLLDERSLLACIVRTIPAGGRIRISSTVSIIINLGYYWGP